MASSVFGSIFGDNDVSLIQGSVSVFADLPEPATSHTGQLWYVQAGSGGLLSILGSYKYPKGLYTPNGSTWELVPFKVKVSEDSTTLVNITNWTEFYNWSFDVIEGDRLIYNNIVYANKTGAYTTTNPTQDPANWDIPDSNIIRYYNDTGSTIDPFTVLHLKSATIVGGELVPTPDIADASKWELTQGTLSVACETIPPGQLGCSVKSFTKLTGGDTSAISPGSQLWLSDDGTGSLTATKPEFPSYSISIGGNYNQEASPDGEILVSITKDVYDTFNDAWDGSIRETFDFRITSDGVTITGTLTNSAIPTDDLTLVFSDGFTTFDTTPGATVTITPGTATAIQLNYVFIDKATKTLQISTSEFPATEHAKIAIIGVLDAATTQTDGALRNQNINDHIKTNDDNGHILHIAERIRSLNAEWDSGTAGSLAGLPSNVYVSTTAGKVWQLHKQGIPAQDMALGDEIHVVNDPVTPYRATSNLNDITSYSDGTLWNNEWSNIVVWGVANKSGEASHLMVNLPSDGYNSEENAIADRNNYTNYTIPGEMRGVGFLIGRYTIRRSGTTFTYNSGVGYLDLRGSVPNNTAGGGTGSSGVTDFTQLTDTPSAYTSQAGRLLAVNSGETALEFTSNMTWDETNGRLGIGSATPAGVLDLSSTTGAFIVPRMTTTERDALAGVNGSIIYNTTINVFNFYENGSWVTK